MGGKRISQQAFIDRVTAHFDKWDRTYDLSRAVRKYRTTSYGRRILVPVEIGCPDHGWQETGSETLMKGRLPRCCAHADMGKKSTKSEDDFIKQCEQVHGKNRYDLSDLNYKNTMLRVKVTCRQHDPYCTWTPIARAFQAGNGCLKCSGKQTQSEDGFIKMCEQVHGKNRYDLSYLNYKNAKSKINVTCKLHDPYYTWTPIARAFQSGNGCLKCSGKQKKSTDDFVTQATILHDFRYTYEKAAYVNTNTPITITCPVHGDWDTTTPSGHLYKQRPKGCPACGNLKRLKKVTKTTEQFVIDAIKAHGSERYDYSKVQYENADAGVIIICPRLNHGEFTQRPISHTRGHGCPKCGEIAKSWDSLEDIFDSNREQNFKSCVFYIYELKRFSGYFKIGIAEKVNARTDEEYSDKPILEIKFNTRQEARLVELDFLNTTFLRWECPKELLEIKWRGYTEVRRSNASYLMSLAYHLLEEINQNGPVQFSIDRLEYDPRLKQANFSTK